MYYLKPLEQANSALASLCLECHVADGLVALYFVIRRRDGDGKVVCNTAGSQRQQRQQEPIVRGDAARPAHAWPFQLHDLLF